MDDHGHEQTLPPFTDTPDDAPMGGARADFTRADYERATEDTLSGRDATHAAPRAPATASPQGAGTGDTVPPLPKYLRGLVDRMQRINDEAAADPINGLDEYFRQGYDLVSSPEAQQAFKISSESEEVRNAYVRNGFGQRCLLARRLIEAGVPFGVPFRPSPFRATVRLLIGGQDVPVERVIEHRYDNIMAGEKRMELKVVPPFAVNVSPEIAVIPEGALRTAGTRAAAVPARSRRQIEVTVEGDEARAESYVQAFHLLADDPSTMVNLWGSYHDRFVRVDGTWVIDEHRIDIVHIERRPTPGRT